MVPRVECTVPPTVADSTTFAWSIQQKKQSTVWPNAKVESSSEGGIKSVHEFPNDSGHGPQTVGIFIANMSPGVVLFDVLKF